MRNSEVITFLTNSPGITKSLLKKALASSLTKAKVDGEMLVSLARKGGESGRSRAIMAMIGVPHSLMKPVVKNARARVAQDKKHFSTLYSNYKRCSASTDMKYKGFSKIRVEGKLIRDSAASIASFLGRKNKTTFSKEPEFFFQKQAKPEPKVVSLDKLSADKLGDWLSQSVQLIHLNQLALSDLVATLRRMNVSGKKLIEVCNSSSSTHMLAAYGIRKNIRKCLVNAVKQASKGSDGPAQRQDDNRPISPSKKKGVSKFAEAMMKAKADGFKSTGWPDIELVHKAPAVQGGTRVVKTLFKKETNLRSRLHQHHASQVL